MTFKISEHISLESSSVKEDGSRRVRLISPGTGSSGIYSAEMLNKYMAEALPKGTLVYLDHTGWSDEMEREGTRSIKDVAGKFVSDPVYEANAPEGEGSYVNIKFKRVVEQDLEDIGDAVGVSIEVHAGRKDEFGNIVEMHYDPLNALALVPVPGRDGRIFENFRAKASESENNNGEADMPISKEDIEAVAERAAALVVEALKPEPKDEQPETDVAALVLKVSESGLPAVLTTPVVEAVLGGADIDEAIKAQEAVVKAIRESAKDDSTDSGVLSESGDGKTEPKTDAERGQAYLERFKKAGK